MRCHEEGRMFGSESSRGQALPGVGAPRGSVMIPTLMAVAVLLILGTTVLTVSYSEDFNARREKSTLLSFYAAEGGIHEALVRMNLDPGGASDDETEIKWNSGTGNPDSVQDPRFVQGSQPEANPANYSDSSIPNYRFWNYDPNWRYSGTSAAGEGNYPGATSTQRANLALAGRAFTYASASPRTLPSGSGYAVRVVPHIRNFAGTWSFVDERGTAAPASTYYYKVTSTGTNGNQSAETRVIVRKLFLTASVRGAVTAAGNVSVGGNASVGAGDPGDENPTGVATYSAGTASTSGSGTIVGSALDNKAYPGFQATFGMTPAEMRASATITATYTADTSNPPAVPSGTVGAVIWITAKDSLGANRKILFTGDKTGPFVLGSPSQPVVLVVDGNLTMNTVIVYGIIYVTGEFRNQGSSQIRGAVFVEDTGTTDLSGTSNPPPKIGYSRSVLNRLDKGSGLFPFRAVKGTWQTKRG